MVISSGLLIANNPKTHFRKLNNSYQNQSLFLLQCNLVLSFLKLKLCLCVTLYMESLTTEIVIKSIFIAFAFNAKSFVIVIILFLLLYNVFGRTRKSYFQIFIQLLLSQRVTSVGVIYMICRALSTHVLQKKNSNGQLKREHLQSSSSPTKNITSPLPQCL